MWKHGIVGAALVLLNLVGMGTVWAKTQQADTSARYNLPYQVPASTTTSQPAATAKPKTTTNSAPVKKTSTKSKYAATTTPNIYSRDIMQETRNVPLFSAIDINGPFKVNLISGDGRQRIVLKGNVNAVPRVTTRVIGNTLVMRMLPSKTGKLVPPYDTRVAVEIHMPREVTAITAGGPSRIYGQGIYSSRLVVTANDQSSIYLSGRISVYQIFCYSSGTIDIALGHVWGLGIKATGTGLIRITGSTNMLTAALGGWQRLDASRLRAQKVYITTLGAAVGQVQPVIALYAFARDSSEIFYYKKPQVMAGNSRDSGNILQLGNW